MEDISKKLYEISDQLNDLITDQFPDLSPVLRHSLYSLFVLSQAVYKLFKEFES